MSVLAILIYSNSFDGVFVADDNTSIVSDRRVHSLEYFSDVENWMTLGLDRLKARPLSYLTFALNYQLNEDDVTGYHIVNLILHIINAVILYFFILFIVRRVSVEKETGRMPEALAAATALIFLVHPIQTQAVTYVVQRMTALASLFYLLAMFSYAKARILHLAAGWHKALPFYLTILPLFLLGTWSKEIIFSLPLALLVYEVVLVRNSEGRADRMFITGFSLLLAAVVTAGILGVGLPADTETVGRWPYFLTQLKSMLIYLRLFFVPINQHFYYDIEVISSLLSITAVGSLLIHFLVLGTAVYLMKKIPLASFGIFLFYTALSVESSVIPIRHLLFEHRMYVSVAGVSLTVVALVLRFTPDGMKKALPFALMVIVSLLSYATYQRNEVYKSVLGFWKDNISKAPGVVKPYSARGSEYQRIGRFKEALEDYKKAIAIDPDNHTAYNNRGSVKALLNRHDEAIEDFRKSNSLHSNASAWNNIASSLIVKKEYQEAYKAARRASYYDRGWLDPYINEVGALIGLERYDEALKRLENLINRFPNRAEPWQYQGYVLGLLGENEEAVPAFSKAIELNPRYVDAYKNRGITYIRLENYQAAKEDFDNYIALTQSGEGHYFRAVALSFLGRAELARQDAQKAIEKGFPVPDEFRNRLLRQQ